MTIGQQIIREAMAKHPDMPARTMARRLYTQNPRVWPSLEATRKAISYATGTLGDTHRKQSADKTLHRPKRNAGEDWRQYLPTPKRTMDESRGPWGPVRISGPCRALILSDIHIPFHDEKALTLAIEYGIGRDADMVILNGDTVDHYALSRWEKDPRIRSFKEELQAARTFFHGLRLAFPEARIYLKHGNHEERYEDTMVSRSPDFLGIDAFEWETVFGLKHERIFLVADKRPIVLGKGLHIMHGHEWKSGAYDPVNPARTYFTKAVGVHVIGGDRHRTSQHSENNLEQNVVSSWSTGCLCELHPKYMPLNKWNHGFAFVTVDAKGAFHVDNLRIIDGEVY